MKRLLLSILILSISYSLVKAQCSGCTMTISSSSSATYTLTGTDVLCITGGTYTGTITAFPSGAKICVSGGAAFNPAAMPASCLGNITISSGSSALLPAITTGAGFKIDNYGIVTFNAGLTFSGVSTINNYAGASMTITQAFTLATTGSSITNNGTITFTGAYTGNNSTNAYNYGYFNCSSTFTNGSSFKNYGKLNVTGNVIFNAGAGSLFQNYCTLISSSGNITNNNTNTGGLSNYGFIIANGAATKITNAAACPWYQTAAGVTEGVNFDNSGTVTGSGNYYFTGTTRSLAGTFGADALGINFYDSSPTGAQVMDNQTVVPNASVTKNNFTPPSTTDLNSTCNITVNKSPVAADDFYITSQNTSVFGNVLANDIDPENNTLNLPTTLLSNVSNGTLSFSSNGDFTYTPNSGYYGTDVFIYSVCDNGTPSKCDTASVTITINQNPIPMPACDNPGTDPTVTLGAVPNTYYPGTASATAGASSITIGAHMVGDASQAIAIGDKLMIIQIQGADINAANTDAYGDGVIGGFGNGILYNANITAGVYEFVTATNTVPITGGSLTIASPLVYSYVNANYVAGTNGQRRFQVIKVPQYNNLTLTANITTPAWNGTVGGVFCISVANTLNMAGFTINAKGQGFRGGGGRQLGAAGGPYTDYRTLASVSHNASKGEGIVGTPQYVNNAGALLNTTIEGYPNGSMGQGAPGNAGGGGTDGDPGANSMNTGGGGGANGGSGGKGGNAWSNAVPDGGEPGALFMAVSANKLILGGGGGAGCSNDGTGAPGAGFASSGAAGGGIVIIYANLVSGTGTIDVSGADANNTVLNDASGGGGAGGSVLLVSNNSLTGVKVLASGGAGGTNTGTGVPHGPGGGGGGGVIYSTSSVNYASRVSGGSNGNTVTASPIAYGATIGSNGKIKATVKKSELPSGFLGCYNFVVAANDNLITTKNVAASDNVLTNDFDVEGNTVSFAGFYDPNTNTYVNSGSLVVAGIDNNRATVANAGTLTIVNTGAYTYTPASNFVGTIDLSYKITDNYSYQATAYAKLKIQVLEGCNDANNVAPINDNVVTYMNVPVTLNVTTNDIDPQGDTLIFNGFINPTNNHNYLINGSTSIAGKDRFGDDYAYAGTFTYGKDGSCTYAPVSHFTGSINIDYEVCDKNANQVCKKANLKISVEPVHTLAQNDYPYTGENAAFTYMNKPLTGPSLLRNAGDANSGDVITINTTPVTAPSHGTLTINSNGTYLYTPTAGYTGPDMFVYRICDNYSTPACSQGIVHIDVIKSEAKITAQPIGQNICNGGNVSFSVTATGTNLTNQWQVSTDNGGTWGNVTNAGVYSGATTATLSITGANTGMNSYLYRCALTTDCNTDYTNPALLLVGNSAISVIKQPDDNSVCNGSNATFIAAASGPSITYQWQESQNNGVSWNDLSNSGIYGGVTTTTLQITGATNAMNNYRYRCVISSTCVASVNTSSAVLNVGSPAVAIINNPVNDQKCSGTNSSFNVYATGASLTYQWQENTGSGWNNLSASSIYTNITNDTLTLVGVTSGMNGYLYRCVVSSGCASSSNSSSATLTVNTTPSITNTTQGTRCGGGSETLSATASAGTINWYTNFIGGSPIATGTNYATPSLVSNTSYYVDATNNGCRTLNRANVLAAVVSDVPSIISHPSDATNCEGSYQSFSIIASSNVTGFQWQLSTDGGSTYSNIIDNGFYNGSLTNTLMLMGIDRTMTGYRYRCIASATCTPNATSNAAILTVNYPPVIVTSPVRSWVCAGNNASFSVVASGGVTGYQWQLSTDAGVTWNDIANGGVYTNATTSTLNITGATAGMNNYLYRCNVTGSCLPATTSNSAPLVTSTNTITINTQPTATSACAATPFSLSVIASGPNLTYQWSRQAPSVLTVTDGGIFSGATTSVLNISDVSTIDGYTYRCAVSSSTGCATAVNSSTVAVTKNTTTASITVPPANSTICEGANTSLAVTASVSAGTITYQWQNSTDGGTNWNNILNTGVYSGANTTPLGITSATSGMNSYLYRVKVGSTSPTICPSNSANATLTVNPLPVAPTSAQTDRDNFCADDAGNINLSVTGGSGTTLRWFTGSCGGALIGTGNPLTIASPATTTTYYARWETACGNSTCASVTVTVKPLAVAPTNVNTDYNNFCESDAGNINLTVTGGSGTLLKWFTGSCGGTLIGTGSPLTLPTPTVSTTYYAYYENSCGVSTCANLLINVNPSPAAPTASASQTFCGSATISNLVATPPGGSTTNWYATSSGGSALAGGFALSNGGTYYAESQNTLSSCVSNSRTPVEAVITATPPAPSGSAAQSFCTGNNPKVSDITLTGNNFTWYTASSGGSVVPGSTSLVSGTTYYASQTWNGCESTSRFGVTATINPTPAAPTGAASQSFCSAANPKVSNISVTGSNIIWYDAASAGNVVAGTTALVNGTAYYASQTVSGCESTSRLAVTVTVNTTPSAPTGSATQTFCSAANPKVSNISVTGSNIIWYDAASAGNVVAGTTALVNGTTYYASQTVTGCESTSRLAVTVTVNTTPSAPTGSATQTFCSAANPKVSNISVTGSNIIWYDAASAGNVVAGTTALVNGTTYYASQTVTGCESTSRLAVTVTVNTTPSAPTGSATQTFCSAANPKVSNISVTGSNIIWYDAASAGNVVAGTTALVNGTTYYASQTVTGCESTSRLAVTITVNTTPSAPTGSATQTFCSASNPKVSNISVTGSNIIWYDAASAGNVVAGTTALVNGTTYYASQTVTGCESTSRLAVTVTVNTTPSAPTGSATQSFCSAANPKVSNISVTGTNIIWYDAASAGNVVAGTTALVNGTTYYASQTVTGCESTSRLAVTVTVNTTPSAPTGSATQTFCSASNPKVSNISVTGSNIVWYDAASAGSVIASNTALANGTTYYASQTVSGCESTSRLAVTVTVNAIISAPTGSASQSFCSASNPKVSDISVTGSNIIWYDATSGGSVVAGSTALVNGTTYYASQTIGGCESTSRLAVTVTVNTTPLAPTGSATQTFCSGANPMVSDIIVVGSNIIWYDAAVGASVVAGNTNLVNGTTYYASQTASGCESTSRLAVTVTVNTTPLAPTGAATQNFCSGANPKVSDISVTGSNIVWYNAAVAGSTVAGNTALVNGTTYYASQTVSGCESASRLAVTVTVNTTPLPPTGSAAQSFCSADNPKVSNISVTGTNIIWYDAVSAGNVVAGTNALVNGTTYYASQTVTGCESTSRLAVAVTVNTTPSAPSGSATQSFCSAANPKVSNISITGTNVIWYDAASAGNVVAGSTALVNGATYYSSQTVSGCESTSRLAVTVTVNTTPLAPTGSATQSFCSADNPKISNISATGTNIIWYDAASAGNVVAGSTVLVNGTTYYASQTVTGCESTSRLAVAVTVNTTPTAPSGTAAQSFCSADNPKVSNISVTGSNITWYDAASAGNVVAGTTALVNGTTYYASQTVSGCESTSRLAVTATVHTTPSAPSGFPTQSFCSADNPKVSDISITGSNIIWYDAASAGNVVAGSTALVNGTTYYASQTASGCESTSRQAVTVTVNTTPGAPTGSAAQSFCSASTPRVSDISVTGSNIIWYDAASAGNIVVGTTALVDGSTYYASQTTNGCESSFRLAVTVTVHTTPGAPTGSTTQFFCSANNPKVSDIAVTGSNIIWHDAASAGNVVAGNTALVDGTTYYASQTTNGCESTARLDVIATVHTSPLAPTGTALQSFCSADNPKVADITVTGSNVIWYDAASAGNVVASNTALVNGTNYYASQTTSGCESATRLAILVTVNTTPAAPAGTATQTFCSSANPKVSNISVTGSNVIWYDAAVAGNAVAGTTSLVDGATYYASQTTSGCESTSRLAITVNVNTTPAAPAGAAAQNFCNGNSPKVSDIVVTGSNIVWYDAAAAGNVIAGNTALVNGSTYYASQSVGGCESTSRTAVTVTILTCSGPNIVNNTVSLDENSANGTSVYNVNDNNTGNDKDVDGNNLTYSIISGNSSGAFTIDPATGIITVADGTKLDYETTPTFVLVVRASNGTITDDASITINLNNLNDNAPVAVADNYSVNEGGTLTIPAPGVLANDNDADGNSLTAIKVTNPAHGTITFNANGSFTYTHDGSETTSDAFTYKVNDGSFDSNTVTVGITVNPVNDPPVVISFAKSVNEDNTLSFALADFTGAYTDPENNPLAKIQITSLPANGVLKLSGVNVNLLDEILATDLANLTFVPDANWNGSTSFTWNGSDGTDYAASDATVNITVNAVNDPPVLSDITTSVNEDNTLTFSALDFTGAFSDIEGNSLTKIKITSLPANGTLKLGGVDVNLNDEILVTDLGTLTFVPDANWNGSTYFGWNGFDGTDYATTAAKVNITVNAVNDAPSVADIYKGALTNATVTFTAADFTGAYSDVENDPLAKIMIVNLPSNGTLYLSGVPINAGDEITAANLGNITFVPTASWNGSTSFAWNASDGSLYAFSSANVNITISATPNNPPVVSNIPKSVNQNNTLTFTAADFTGAYSDADSNPLVKIKITSLPANATLKLSGIDVALNDEIPVANLGNLTLVPDVNWSGNTSFGWNGFDGTVYANTAASVNVTVVANNAPIVSTVAKTVNEDNTLMFASSDFTGAYTDADSNPLVKIKITSLPPNGSLKLSGNPVAVNDEIAVANIGNLTFTPAPDWNGGTSFGWNGFDGTAYAIDDDNVNITVNPVNDLPTLSDVTKTTNEDNTVTFSMADFTGPFTDVDGDALVKIKITSLPANGTLMLNGVPVNINDEIPVANLGNLTFVPNANWNGTTSFAWNGFDGTSYAAVNAHVNIIVNAVNDPPVLTNPILTQTIPENNGATSIDIPGNTVNTDGDILTTSIVTNPKHGTVSISNGQLVYTPNTNFVGNDTITYQVCDNGTPSLCVTGTVVVTVTTVVPANHPPVLVDAADTTVQDQTLPFNRSMFTSKFTDVDNDTLVKIRFVSLPSHGTLQLNGTPIAANQEIPWADLNKLTFVPETGFVGQTSFAWEASDGKDYSATSATVTITMKQAEVFIPEGFSPNGDGVNDYFVIKGADKYVVTLHIYNRWGNLVYESKHYQNDWDGISNRGLLLSSKLPDGTYFYSINFNNGEKEKVGFITINR